MSLETLRQNTEALIEVINSYNYLCQKREQASKKEKEELENRIALAKQYILKLLAMSDRLTEEARDE